MAHAERGQVLRTFSDKTFNIATGVSVLTLLLATVFGPLETFLKTKSLDVQQWLICNQRRPVDHRGLQSSAAADRPLRSFTAGRFLPSPQRGAAKRMPSHGMEPAQRGELVRAPSRS